MDKFNKSVRPVDFFLWLSFFIFLYFCFRYQLRLLSFREFGDESETIVAAKMMASGTRMYSEIFNHHGPLTFLPGVFLETLGEFGVRGHRVVIAVLQALSVISIALSPILQSKPQKVVVTTISAVIMLVYLPPIFGHMYIYQNICGIFLVLILSQYSLVSIYSPDKLNKFRIITGNFLIISLPFLAVTYFPVAFLLFILSFTRRNYKFILLGALLAILFNLLFLISYGSVKGYLAYHFYLNLKVLPEYSGAAPGFSMILTILSTLFSDLSHFIAIVVIFVGVLNLASVEKYFPWRSILLSAGLATLVIRGGGFHGVPFFYAVLPFICFCIFKINMEKISSKIVIVIFILVCGIKISLLLPGDKFRNFSPKIPTSSEFSRLVSSFTNKNDKILAYSFRNYEYLASDRLPASGYYFYLPWQEKYNQKPILNISIDPCKDIIKSKPKVILMDKWKVWNKFSWEGYGTCVQKIVDRDYFQFPDRPFYLRKDLICNYEEFSKEKLKISAVKTSSLEIDTFDCENCKKNPYALDILIPQEASTNENLFEFNFKANGNVSVKKILKPEKLSLGRYKRFILPDGSYTSAQILSTTGRPLSVFSNDKNKPCVRIVFKDGSSKLTPGCPIN